MSYLEQLLPIKFKLNVSNSPLSRLAISRALKNCLIAQASTYSGTSNAQINNGRRCSANDNSWFKMHLSIQLFASRFFGLGMFGWTATQVHEKIVTRQLHTMFEIDRQCMRSVQRFVFNGWLSANAVLGGHDSIQEVKSTWSKTGQGLPWPSKRPLTLASTRLP